MPSVGRLSVLKSSRFSCRRCDPHQNAPLIVSSVLSSEGVEWRLRTTFRHGCYKFCNIGPFTKEIESFKRLPDYQRQAVIIQCPFLSLPLSLFFFFCWSLGLGFSGSVPTQDITYKECLLASISRSTDGRPSRCPLHLSALTSQG